MPNCNFSINFTGTAEDLVAKALKGITEAGGTFTGNAESGSFSAPTPVGQIKGTYTITGQTINIIIVQKPFLVTCNRIENELRKYLSAQEPARMKFFL